ncbi:MAG: hypothetical protein WD533_04925 [Dehalococcoidia bacterium]
MAHHESLTIINSDSSVCQITWVVVVEYQLSARGELLFLRHSQQAVPEPMHEMTA